VLAHGLDEHQGADEVVVVVLHGLVDGLAHGLVARKVDDGVDSVGVLVSGVERGGAFSGLWGGRSAAPNK
jgi:hypothetical protein